MSKWLIVGAFGAGIGIVQLIIAYIAYRASKNPPLEALKYFAYGMVVLAISHIFCKTIMKAWIGLYYPWGVPLKAIGLTLVIYSIMALINKEVAKRTGILAAVLGVIFTIGSIYSLLTTEGRDWIFASVHVLFLTLLPWYVAYLSYKVYKESGDKSGLYVAAAFWIYGLATVLNIALLSIKIPMYVSMSIALPTRLIAEMVMLYAFIGA